MQRHALLADGESRVCLDDLVDTVRTPIGISLRAINQIE
jgi:hypothetical protein